ncbi:unnamed protein product [Leuciscus chuanchicus]
MTASQQLLLRASDEAWPSSPLRGHAGPPLLRGPRSRRRWRRRPKPTLSPRAVTLVTTCWCWAATASSLVSTRVKRSVGSWRTTWATPRSWLPATSGSGRKVPPTPPLWPTRTHPAFAEQLRYHRVHEEARARATQPGCEGEALVGFGDYKEATLKDLYNSKEKKHQTQVLLCFVKWLRRKTPQPGTSMDAARKYILDREKELSAEAAATPPPPTSSSSSTPTPTTTTTSSGPSKAAASTALPPRKSIAPMFSALLGRRPMAPDEFQVQCTGLTNHCLHPSPTPPSATATTSSCGCSTYARGSGSGSGVDQGGAPSRLPGGDAIWGGHPGTSAGEEKEEARNTHSCFG